MRLAQGNKRSAPDGYLHLWNFAATKGSGLAGALFNYVMTDRQRGIAESALIELAEKVDTLEVNETKEPTAHVKHETWRFKKEFLQASPEERTARPLAGVLNELKATQAGGGVAGAFGHEVGRPFRVSGPPKASRR